MILQGDWHGCYRDGWQGLIVPDAFAHPAKFSRSLIRRIYDHMREEGWLPPGSVILDPFGGVALGALDAMRIGCQWVGLELEEKFVTLGAQNIAQWNARFSSLPGWGSAVILQGESRKLLAWNFAGPPTDAVVGSPPFCDQLPQFDKAFKAPNDSTGNLRGNYGTNPSNLGNLPDKGFDAAVGSPPWAAQMNEGGAKGDPPGNLRRVRAIQTGRNPDSPSNQQFYQSYGTSPGQLAAMPEGAFEGVVSSPPYEVTQVCTEQGQTKGKEYRRSGTHLGADLSGEHGYGLGDNLGNSSGDTFWLAARQILDQCFLVVRPGGHAVWVVKAFVRKGKRVDFPSQWRQLCEAVGFRCVHVHRAWLVEESGIQGRTDGGETRLTMERKSFFRRLAEKKGSPRIDWEDVICMERP